MKPLHKAIIAFILLGTLCLCSCRSKKEFTQTNNTTKIDTVYKERVKIDTVKITELKEVTKPIYLDQEIDCAEDQSGTFKSGNSFITWWVKDGKVHFKAEIEGETDTFYQKEITSLNTEIERLKSVTNKQKETTSEIVKYKTDWRVVLWAIIATVLALYLLFRKLIKKFIVWAP